MFEGVFTALVTPFRDGQVDVPTLRDLVERQIAAGVDGLVPCGTTGEAMSLDWDEHALVVRTVVEQARGRLPVVAGAGSGSTGDTVALCRIAREAGADGVLLVCPYYVRPQQAGVEGHFRRVLQEVPIPAMLYNIPGRTAFDLETATLARLADVPHVVAIKEATGNVLRAQQIVARCGDRFAVLSGDDALTLGMLAVGGRGVVSVTSNLLPGAVREVVQAWRAGDVEGARRAHLRLLAVHEALFVESNPAPIKYAMARAGLLRPEVRLPLAWPADGSRERIDAALAQCGLRP